MSEVRSGFYWHVHHEVLVEWCFDEAERRHYIETEKPINEQATRLRLFRPVTGTLPQAFSEAGRAYDEAWRAHADARRAYVVARRACQVEIERLHATECVNCPWDGHTIFPVQP